MRSTTKHIMVEVEKEVLAYQASDEMLEIAAETAKGQEKFQHRVLWRAERMRGLIEHCQ